MSSRIVILGAGTGGTLTANRLRRHFRDGDVSITVVDQDDRHVYQPGLLFVPFGLAQPEDIVRPRARQLHSGIEYVQEPIGHVNIENDVVVLEGGSTLPYDVLVVATGAVLAPEETEGLTGPGWGVSAFTFYDMPGASALERALDEFEGGRMVVNLVDLPIKCPVAPLEFCFLADWYLHQRGIRDAVQLTYATPLDGAFTKPVASAALGGLLAEKGVELVTEFNAGEVAYSDDGRGGRVIGYDGRELEFDLAVVIPLHDGAEYVGRSPGLGDELRFVPTDPATLRSIAKENVFAIGDATNLPVSKAGSVTHFEGEVLAENVIRHLEGRELDATLRRSRQLLHRDRLLEGPADRLQLRDRAPARALPRADRHAAPQGEPAQPPRQADVPVVLLAHAPARAATSRASAPQMPTARQAPPRRRGARRRHPRRRTRPHEHRHLRRRHRRRERRGLLRAPRAVDARDRRRARPCRRHRRAHRPALAGHRLHARASSSRKGTGPTVRVLGKASGVSVKELYQLFPKGPAKMAAHIAGIPKPKGCI